MNSHLPWLKQEHDEEDFDESYTTENQLVYDNKSIRHLNQGLTIQQYQQIQALAHVHPDLHPHHLSSPNPLDYRTGYSQAHSQAPYHLNESYPAGQSLDGYSHYPENQAHFDEFADIIPYSNHVMSTPNATPDGSPSMSRVRLMNGMEGIPTERDFNLLVTEREPEKEHPS
ncbi:MAG: hypothetical protein M1836_002961 [Candelina mexicana]|nr:MAG: hypothetical protein M1836_002961 [Candelina mexicana]